MDAAQATLALIKSFSLPELRAHLSSLVRRYSDLIGEVPFEVSDNVAEIDLRARAAELASQIYRAHALRDAFERTRRRLLRGVLSIGVLFALATAAAVVLGNKEGSREFMIVMFAGAAGGITSCIRRLYLAEPGTQLLRSLSDLRSTWVSVGAAPLLGAIFAIVLHLCFVGGLIKGSLFPELTVGTQVATMKGFIFGIVSGTPADFAKVILWCFLAGFAERLVPDMLDRLAAQATTAPQRRPDATKSDRMLLGTVGPNGA